MNEIDQISNTRKKRTAVLENRIFSKKFSFKVVSPCTPNNFRRCAINFWGIKTVLSSIVWFNLCAVNL